MPWCEPCSRFLTPTSLGEAGECPNCGQAVVRPSSAETPRAPWHFKLLVVAASAYLLLRAYQGVAWLVARL